jgi:hypothetical protein
VERDLGADQDPRQEPDTGEQRRSEWIGPHGGGQIRTLAEAVVAVLLTDQGDGGTLQLQRLPHPGDPTTALTSGVTPLLGRVRPDRSILRHRSAKAGHHIHVVVRSRAFKNGNIRIDPMSSRYPNFTADPGHLDHFRRRA